MSIPVLVEGLTRILKSLTRRPTSKDSETSWPRGFQDHLDLSAGGTLLGMAQITSWILAPPNWWVPVKHLSFWTPSSEFCITRELNKETFLSTMCVSMNLLIVEIGGLSGHSCTPKSITLITFTNIYKHSQISLKTLKTFAYIYNQHQTFTNSCKCRSNIYKQSQTTCKHLKQITNDSRSGWTLTSSNHDP